jgi:membrane protease YdiL (CAAX protease family)
MPSQKAAKLLGLALRVGVYALLAIAGTLLFGQVLLIFGYLVASALGVFLAAVIANSLAMRIFERAHLVNIGLAWNPSSVRNLLVGLAGGGGAASIVLAGPAMFRLAEFQAVASPEPHWRTLLYVTAILIFGAVGEELLFRGYAFQAVMASLGPFATILPFGVIFGFAHVSNPGISDLGLINTMAWGIVLGYAFLRSGDLWLPIGVHLGWNWALPLAGVNLSGFTMNVTGYALHWKIGPLWSGGDYGPEGGLLTSGVVVLLCIYLWKAPVRRQVPFLVRNLAGED